MLVAGGTTSFTTYFVMRLAATGVGATGLTATNFDLTYTRSGATAVKADATLNANGIGGAWSDTTVIEVDATNAPGLYRTDWPNAALAAAVPAVILTVKCATAFTEHMRIEIDPPVNVVEWAGTDVVAGAIPAAVAGAAGGVFIAGANAATSVTTALTANITGNVSGSVGSLTGHTVQTGDSYALANGATGFVAIDTVVDAVKVVTDALPDSGALTTIAADAARLTAARAGVLTDWIDGGRLDAILDTIRVDTLTTIPGLLSTTGVILTATGADLILKSSPFALAIADAVWDELKSGHAVAASYGAYLDAAISGVGGAVGPGADSVTLEILEDDNVTPIADADVWVSTDLAGSNVVAGTSQTNSLGKFTFQLTAGLTYYRWAQKDGINFTNPTSFVAVAD